MSDYDKMNIAGAPGRTTSATNTSNASPSNKSDGSTVFTSDKKKVLPEDEIKLLQFLGIDPDDTVAVENWRSLPIEQKQAQWKQFEDHTMQNISSSQQESQVENANASVTETPSAEPEPQPLAETAETAPSLENESPSQPAQNAASGTDANAPIKPKFDAALVSKLEPPKVSDLIPDSAAQLANTKINLDTSDTLLASMSTKQWKALTAEQKLNVVHNYFSTKFKGEFENFTPEEKEAAVIGLIENKIKETKNISEEDWNNYSDKKKEREIKSFVNDFALKMVGGYSKEDFEKLSFADKIEAEVNTFREVQQLSNKYASQGEKADADMDYSSNNNRINREIRRIETYATALDNANKADEIRNAYNDASEYSSLIEKYTKENNIELATLTSDASEEVKQQFSEYIQNALKDKSADEIQEILRVDILSNAPENNKLLLDTLVNLDKANNTTNSKIYNSTALAYSHDELVAERKNFSTQKAISNIIKSDKELSLSERYAKEHNIDFATLNTNDRKVIRQYSDFINKELHGKSEKEIKEIMAREILRGDKNKLVALNIALKSIDRKNNDTKLYDSYASIIEALSKTANLNSTDKQKVEEAVSTTVATVNANDSMSVNAIGDLAQATINTGNTEDTNTLVDNLKGTKNDTSKAAEVLMDAGEQYNENTIRLIQNTDNNESKIKSAEAAAVRADSKPHVLEIVPEIYKPAEGKEADGVLQLEMQDAMLKANPKSANLQKAVSKATPYIAKNSQTEFFNRGFNASEELDEAEQIEVQKAWVEVIPECDKDNQLAMFNTTMTSKHDEVLEYSSSNINRLDTSVQADAIKSVYNTGNQKAIDACNSQLESCSKEAVKTAEKTIGKATMDASRAQTEARTVQDAARAYADAIIENKKITQNLTEADEIKNLSETEKKEYYVNYFMKATDAGRYNLLSQLSDTQLKDVISKLCKYNSSMIKGLVQQGLGKYVLQTLGKSPDVLYSTINIMLQKGGKDGKFAAEYVISNKTLIHFSDDVIEKAEETLGKNNYKVSSSRSSKQQQLENETVQYQSNPYGFAKSTLYPRMSAIYPNKKNMFYNA